MGSEEQPTGMRIEFGARTLIPDTDSARAIYKQGWMDGLREAFEAACKAECALCAERREIFYTSTGQAYFHRVDEQMYTCNAHRVRRAAQQMGVPLDAEKEK